MGRKDRSDGMVDTASKGFATGCGAVPGVLCGCALILIVGIITLILLFTGAFTTAGAVVGNSPSSPAQNQSATPTRLQPVRPRPSAFTPTTTTTTTIPAPPAHPQHKGMVIRIVDGDTMMVKIGNKQERVRLRNIDAPEKGEPGFEEATQALRKRFPGACRVIVTEYARDKYGRLVATIERE